MPRRKKKPSELTTDEAMRKLFPAKVHKAAKQEAKEARKSEGTTKPKSR